MKKTISNLNSDENTNNFKYCHIFMLFLGTIILVSNVCALKPVYFFHISLTGAFLFYPFTYPINCILAEVYGYKNARVAIWSGFLMSIIFSLCVYITAILPPAHGWNLQQEFYIVLVPEIRVVFASLISFLIADFVCSYFIAKSKIKNSGHNVIVRIISSTILSIVIGVITFIPLAFYGNIPNDLLYKITVFAVAKKILFQIFLLPITVYLIQTLKRIESIDLLDTNTNFNPFKLDNVYRLRDIIEFSVWAEI